MIPMAMRDHFVVAYRQMYVAIAHRMADGIVTVSAPNFSARIPDHNLPKLDPAFAIETR